MKIALVHDYLNQYGGAEKVLEAFIEIFPDAPIYTLIHDPAKLRCGVNSFKNKDIRTSFLQKVPFAKTKHRIFPPLMPLAIEKFDLSGYDVVLSDSASFAKGVITKPETLHICYCYTPTRYIWDDSHKYIREFSIPSFVRPFIPLFMNYIRIWDREAAHRVDEFICTSKFVAKRIKKYYKRNAKVIYPPVDIKEFAIGNRISNYFLIIGRLLPYKRFDIAIKAFNKLELPLKIIGNGPERKKLEKMAKWNIEFLGEVTTQELKKYYQSCQALIFPQEEDFGLVAVEAMACGRPVIAYKSGGALESVKHGKTGVFFNEQTPECLIKTIKNFQANKFNPHIIRPYAIKFDKEIFKKKIKEFIEKTYNEYRN